MIFFLLCVYNYARKILIFIFKFVFKTKSRLYVCEILKIKYDK